jgi:uncharacterized protein
MKNTHLLIICLGFLLISPACQQTESSGERNLANVAEASGKRSRGVWVQGLNDGLTSSKEYPFVNFPSNWQKDWWIQYEWTQPVSTSKMDIFFWTYNGYLPFPAEYRITYWNGEDFVPVSNASASAPEDDRFNTVSFDKVETTRIRLEADSAILLIANVLEWKVYQAEDSPDHPMLVDAGGDRDVMLGGKTYLSGKIKTAGSLDKSIWRKESGPGNVVFENPKSPKTSAVFSETGEYILSLAGTSDKQRASSSIRVLVHQPPPEERLDVVYTKRYSIESPLWNKRAKAIMVNWIPHCIDQINRTDLERGQGGIDNFIETAKALRGEPHGPHLGYVFSNAWVHQTIESMCIALMIDPKGDSEIIKAQEKMEKTIEDWIPKILAAQEPDGYLQTAFTLRDTTRWKERWSPLNRSTHEGYVAGYFLESAINHYTLTEGKDLRLYNAAKKLADCWVENIGSGKKAWYDGHQEMEQGLVRFGRFVNDMEGNGRGDSYVDLAKFLLDNRDGGSEYDQSHVCVQEQYEAVGHAVRAVYSYSGMADVAAETADPDYQSAVMSLWNNMVNKKYYVTGGVGSGETSEGFGPNYSLRNDAYNESCSSCGLIFFQYKMNLAYHDAKYADLYEETMYNALLGSLDLEARNFYYQNPLVTDHSRYDWHVCPCCVGNIPRTLLMVPTWTYVKGPEGVYVNLFIGSTIKVESIAGTNVEMIQETDYPWKGDVSIIVNPEEEKEFTVFIRVPDRTTSLLYEHDPLVSGLESLAVNGEPFEIETNLGYAAIKRTWEPGDRIDFRMPMEIQRITADERIEENINRVALRYGPLIYNVESLDQDIEKTLGSDPLTLAWDDDLLEGVMTIKGKWEDGTPFMAIPNYARMNRTGSADPEQQVNSVVWIRQ